MRINAHLTLAAAGLALLTIGAASAAATPSAVLAPVLDACPIEDSAGCADAVAGFIASRPAETLNEEIVDLVAALAYAADHPNMTPAMCVELQEGIRVAGAAVTLPAPKQTIKATAENLCDTVEVTFSTAADADSGNSSGASGGGASSGGTSSGGSSSGGSSSGSSSSGGTSSGGSSSGGSSSGGTSSGGSSSGGDIPDID
jgi:hypothetical protein